MWLEDFAAWINRLVLFFRDWRRAGLPIAGWDASVRLEDFAAWMNRLIFFFRDWRRADAFLAACNHWGEFYIDSKMQVLSLDAIGEVQALFLFR